jgi:hypothetical protein
MQEAMDRRPDADQARTARHVRELLREHPLLEPLRRAHVPVLVTRSLSGIGVHALLAGGERQLAKELRDRWEARG